LGYIALAVFVGSLIKLYIADGTFKLPLIYLGIWVVIFGSALGFQIPLLSLIGTTILAVCVLATAKYKDSMF